ncbi:NAD(+)/NADH kinase [soil metagenome]
MRIHLLANTYREDAIQAACDAAKWLGEHDVQVFAEEDTAKATKLPEVSSRDFRDCDLIVAFGGDGTLIKAAHLAEDSSTPILGVYYGRFGFVTQCTGDNVVEVLAQFLNGEAKFEERMMLQAELLRGGQTVLTLHALNEIILQRSATVRMITLGVIVDGHRLTNYPADGVILSTATGSTAYNLSVGGPILDPRVQAIILSALAPHTLSARPLVLRPDSEVRLDIESEGDVVLSADGQKRIHILTGDVVKLTRSPRVTKLLSVDSDDFLIKLGQRLFWSQSLLGESY